jgi:uroporphyrinogen decarboxylase
VTRRQVVKFALEGRPVPYTPWSFRFTVEARQKLAARFGTSGLAEALGDHIVELGSDIGFFEVLGRHRFRDVFGAVWDRTVDRDIGNVETPVLPGPSLDGYALPDPLDSRFFADIPEKLERRGDCFRLFCLGFSLFERAWTLRGMENLLCDFHDHPGFVRALLRAVADYDIAQVEKALEYDIDAVCFGDDWGQQRGLIMGYPLWKEFIYPELKRLYGLVRDRGRHVFIHSCGDVDELFDDLIAIGVNCFNPFQPEVMDVDALFARYRGRLSFWGGMSTQRTLPFGSPAAVHAETRHLLAMGRKGNYVFSPAHAVEGDVPLENILAFVEACWNQAGYQG